jgi:hypothetical protein
MPSFGFFACPRCIQDFRLRNWPTPNLPACAKVFVVCPGCTNTLEFFAFETESRARTVLKYFAQARLSHFPKIIVGTRG